MYGLTFENETTGCLETSVNTNQAKIAF